MKRMIALFLLLFCLTGCGSKVDLMPNASPETSALCLTVYDGEDLTCHYLFETEQIRTQVMETFHQAKAKPTKVDVTTLQPPFYGLEMGGADGWPVEGLWSDGYFITGDGSVYAFDYDFEAMMEAYSFEEPEPVYSLSLMPCANYVAKTETNWNHSFLTPAVEPTLQDSVFMTVAMQTDTHLVMEITNHLDEGFGYGHAFGLDVLLDGVWYDVPPMDGALAFTEELLWVNPGETARENCWIEAYGELPSGTYRVVMSSGLTAEFSVD